MGQGMAFPLRCCSVSNCGAGRWLGSPLLLPGRARGVAGGAAKESSCASGPVPTPPPPTPRIAGGRCVATTHRFTQGDFGKLGLQPPQGAPYVVAYWSIFGSQKPVCVPVMVLRLAAHARPVVVSRIVQTLEPPETWYLPIAFDGVAAPIASMARTPTASPQRALFKSILVFIILHPSRSHMHQRPAREPLQGLILDPA